MSAITGSAALGLDYVYIGIGFSSATGSAVFSFECISIGICFSGTVEMSLVCSSSDCISLLELSSITVDSSSSVFAFISVPLLLTASVCSINLQLYFFRNLFQIFNTL